MVIARIPEGRSIIFPGSACPRCGKSIAWHDNLPVLSYALLQGRCRNCQDPISWRYPAVELSCGLLFVLAYHRFEAGTALASALILLAGLVAITAIDLDHQIIPDVLSLPGIVLVSCSAWPRAGSVGPPRCWGCYSAAACSW